MNHGRAPRSAPGSAVPARARKAAIAVIANHHNLLLALPGRGAQRTEADRRRLAQLLAMTNEDQL